MGTYYWDFFSENPKDHFSRNFPFKFFYSSPYNEPVPYVVGKKFFKRKVHANANFIADAYANFGYVGVLVVVFFFLIVLKLIDDFSYNKNKYVILSFLTMPFFSLTNMSFITVSMTHGLLFALLMIILYPEDKNG